MKYLYLSVFLLFAGFVANIQTIAFVIPTTSIPKSNAYCYLQQKQFHSKNNVSKLFMSLNNDDNDNEMKKNNEKKIDNLDQQELWIDEEDLKNSNRRSLIINAVAVGLLGASAVASAQLFSQTVYAPTGFKRLPVTQFIAALGDPNANSGSTAQDWGLWKVDPGPRGVWLRNYQQDLASKNNIAPAGWKFNLNDWWLEEHGLIMEAPQFPVPPGRYLVTGGRMVTTGLTISSNGEWKLDDPNAKLYDVTHLPCRSARYSPVSESSSSSGSPLNAKQSDFPVRPGAEMPAVPGCNKQDYAVLFLVGKAV